MRRRARIQRACTALVLESRPNFTLPTSCETSGKTASCTVKCELKTSKNSSASSLEPSERFTSARIPASSRPTSSGGHSSRENRRATSSASIPDFSPRRRKRSALSWKTSTLPRSRRTASIIAASDQLAQASCRRGDLLQRPGDGVQLGAQLLHGALQLRPLLRRLRAGAAQPDEPRAQAFERVEQAGVLGLEAIGRQAQQLALSLLLVDGGERAAQGSGHQRIGLRGDPRFQTGSLPRGPRRPPPGGLRAPPPRPPQPDPPGRA